jgi:hypothetical protein
MTTQDRDRLKVLHEVKKKHITQKEANTESGSAFLVLAVSLMMFG